MRYTKGLQYRGSDLNCNPMNNVSVEGYCREKLYVWERLKNIVWRLMGRGRYRLVFRKLRRPSPEKIEWLNKLAHLYDDEAIRIAEETFAHPEEIPGLLEYIAKKKHIKLD
jgi:hypothetical protein